MTTITLKVSEADKRFIKAMAKFEVVSLSELIRTKTLEALEDEYDANYKLFTNQCFGRPKTTWKGFGW